MGDHSAGGDAGYDAPRLAINRIYTKKGDDGTTALSGGQRLRKDDLRIDAYGTVDELNAMVGAARQTLSEAGVPALQELCKTLLRIQHELFNLGGSLATLPADLRPSQARVGPNDIEALERSIDTHNAELSTLRAFVLPGGSRANTDLHLARTVCRRAERLLVRLAAREEVPPTAISYLNRLSDAFFVWSRFAAKTLHAEEVLWDPNRATSGSR